MNIQNLPQTAPVAAQAPPIVPQVAQIAPQAAQIAPQAAQIAAQAAPIASEIELRETHRMIFQHPFAMMVCGPTSSGKTYWVKK